MGGLNRKDADEKGGFPEPFLAAWWILKETVIRNRFQTGVVCA